MLHRLIHLWDFFNISYTNVFIINWKYHQICIRSWTECVAAQRCISSAHDELWLWWSEREGRLIRCCMTHLYQLDISQGFAWPTHSYSVCYNGRIFYFRYNYRNTIAANWNAASRTDSRVFNASSVSICNMWEEEQDIRFLRLIKHLVSRLPGIMASCVLWLTE